MFSPNYCASGANAVHSGTSRRPSIGPLEAPDDQEEDAIADSASQYVLDSPSLASTSQNVFHGHAIECKTCTHTGGESVLSGASKVSSCCSPQPSLRTYAAPQSISGSGSTLSGGSSHLRAMRLNNRVPTQPSKQDAATWNTFLSAYQKGQWKRISDDAAADEASAAAEASAKLAGATAPQLKNHTTAAQCSKSSRKVYIENGNSIDNHAFFEMYDYMAAPPLPADKRRLRTEVLVSHGFTGSQERPSVDRYVRHARSVFRCDFAAVTVASSDERSTLLLARDGSACSMSLSTLSAMCGHAMLLDRDEVLVVSDIAKDWRFRKLAARHDDGSHALRFYASAPILLSVAADGEKGSNLVHVGRLTIMRHEPWDDFSEDDAAILLDIAGMTQEALENEYLHAHGRKLRAMQREGTSLSHRLNRLADSYKRSPDQKARSKLGVLSDPEHMRTLTDALLRVVKPTCVSAFDVSGFRALHKKPGPGRLHQSDTYEQSEDGMQRQAASEKVSDPEFSPAHVFHQSRKSISVDEFELDPLLQPKLVASSGIESDIPSVTGTAQVRELCSFFSYIKAHNLFAKPQWFSQSDDGSSEEEEDDGEASFKPKNSLGSLLKAPYEVSCAIPVFDSYRTRPLLIFLLTWREKQPMDEADKLFCYTIGIIAAGATFREQAGLAESTQLDFIRSVQHELRTPLNGIMGITEFLRVNLINDGRTEKLDVGENSVLAHLLESLRLSGVNLSSALDDVLDFGAHTASREQRDSTTATTVSLTAEIMTVSKAELELVTLQDRQNKALNAVSSSHSGVPTLIVDVDESLSSRVYRVDSQRLRKILSKILSNALHFTKEGCLVSLSVKQAEELYHSRRQSAVSHVLLHVTEWIDFIIQDEGIGMSPSFLSNSFNTVFSKEDSFSAGLGLGVTIASGLIESLGGTMQVQSAQRQGTRVRISLPLERVFQSTTEQGALLLPSILEKVSEPALHYAAFYNFASSGSMALKSLLEREFSRVGIRSQDDQQQPKIVVVNETDLEPRGDQLVYIGASGQSKGPIPRHPDGRFVIIARQMYSGNNARIVQGLPGCILVPPFGREGLVEVMQFIQCEDIQLPEPTSLALCPTATADTNSTQSVDALSNSGSDPFSGETKTSAGSTSSATGHIRADLHRNKSSFSTTRLSDASTASATPSSASEAPPVDAFTPMGAVENAELAKASHKHIWSSEALEHPNGTNDEEPRLFRVLVVEDNPVNMKLITNVLTRGGFVFAEAKDGREAVAQFKLFQPSIVLLDISLPLMDGFEACVEMRAHKLRHTPRIVAVTALSSADDRSRGLEVCGMDDWWTKPLNIRALRSDIHAFKTDWDSVWISPTSP